MKNSRLVAWQWGTVALLTLGYAGYYVCRTNLSVATPLLIADYGKFGIDKKAIGLITSWGTIAYTVGKFSNGILSDFLGGKRMFLVGMVASVLCTIFFGLGATFGIFAVAWTLNRFVQSMGWASLTKVTSRWFAYEGYGRAMAFLSLSFLLGSALVKVFLGWVIYKQGHHQNWHQLFFIAAGTLFLIAIVNAVLLKSGPRDIGEPEPEINPRNVFGEAGDAEQPEGLRGLLLPFFTSPSFWVVAVLSFCLTLIRETFNTWTPTYLHEVGTLSVASAASYSSVFDLFGSVSVLACGFLTDRVFKGRRGDVMVIGLGLSIFAMLGMSLVKPGGATIPIALTAAVGLLTIGPYSYLAGAISLDLGGKRGSGTAVGLIDGIGYIGGTFSGYGVASIAESSGWGAAFGVLTGVSIVSLAAAVVYWLRYERAAPTPTPIEEDFLTPST